MEKQIHIRIDQDTKRWLKRRCTETRRSLNQEVAYIIQQERGRQTEDKANVNGG